MQSWNLSWNLWPPTNRRAPTTRKERRPCRAGTSAGTS